MTTTQQQQPPAQDAIPDRVSFLLVPGFSMLAFVSAVEPLRVANRMAARHIFDWQILSLDGEPVTASNGMRVVADAAYESVPRVSTLFVCAGFEPGRFASQPLSHWLRRMVGYRAMIGAIDTGCFLLAQARLLNGYRVTLHWESVAAFAEAFPNVHVTQELFEVDRNRMTCAGGTAAMDMMLYMIAGRDGQALATAVSEQFIRDRIRDPSDHQRMKLSARLGINNPHVVRVVERMENNIDTPVPAATLAHDAGISLRQLERLFASQLGHTPQQYYLHIRLTQARRLVQQSEMQIISIALACGFTSTAPFSRAYKAHFGRTPRQDRQTAVP